MIHWGSSALSEPRAGRVVGTISPAVEHEPDFPLVARWDARLKNVVGPVVAGCGLILLSPVFLVIAIAVKLSSPGPVFHYRRVVGQHGRTFDALKFRTMVVGADDVLAQNPELRQAYLVKQKLADDPRTTPVGRFLRRYSLDELPQLINVIRGQMWLIGPRMISPEELQRYGRHASRLLLIKPGMTGLWQVSGRQNTTYERRVELDMQYLDKWTPWLDLTILFRTLSVVMTGRGAY
jgi:lipopolysaccharide/colanic/teichoic acid biosynthesis glycosyltransferase